MYVLILICNIRSSFISEIALKAVIGLLVFFFFKKNYKKYSDGKK